MSPFDVLMGIQGIQPLLRRTGDTPLRFAGRVLGLGTDQQEAGVPKWAWLGVGLVLGAAVALTYGEDAKRAVRALRR